jgi:hypothetical protein
MKTNTYFWSYLAQFFLEREIFHTKVVEKIEHTFYVQELSPRKLCRLLDNAKKYLRAGQATDDNTAHAHCMLDT